MSLIASVVGRLINDSRGQPTVEVTLTDDAGKVATASLPAGSSVGKYEALSVPADQAVNTINTVIAPKLLRQPLNTLQELDTLLESFDPSRGNQNIGVNSTLGISLAGARLLAQLQGQSVYKYLQALMGIQTSRLPIPMFNVINGGKHAQNNLDFQEYMLIPLGLKSFHEQFEAGRKIFGTLGQLLQAAGLDTQIGYEGGYAPNLSTNEEGIGYLVQAIEKAGYVPGADIVLGLDIAASSISSTYTVNKEAYISLFENFPLFSIEDPFSEDAPDEWVGLKTAIDALDDGSHTRLIVGDDLFAGNIDRFKEGIQKQAANSILIKINQSATLSEILECIKLAQQNGYYHIMSHRSGETLDAFISDLAVGTGAAFIKAGSPSDQAPERMVKYERLVEIEEELTVVRNLG